MNNQEVLSQAPEMLNNRPARDFTIHIDRFGYIFRCDHYLIPMPVGLLIYLIVNFVIEMF